MRTLYKQHAGFTLIEMIVVMVITGIIGGMIAMFIRAPIQGYADSSRRAEMGDIADTALRRIGRDLRIAVPNSIRLPNPAGSTYVEFLPTSAGGRYRADPAGGIAQCGGSALGDALSFDAADTCFSIIGPPITFTADDAIIIGSTQSDGSLPYLGVATATGVRRMLAPAGAGLQPTVRMTSTTTLPASAELEGRRFQVVPAAQQAVTYACENVAAAPAGGNGPGTLRRYWLYGFVPIQPVPPITLAGFPGVQSAILATNLSECNFEYDASNQRNSLVALRLSITQGGEIIRLYHTIHVNNIP